MATVFSSFVVLIVTIIFCSYCLGETFANSLKIINGRPAIPGEVPYQLSLRTYDGAHFCGASLVSRYDTQFAISAAHCIPSNPFVSLFLVAGDLLLNDTSPTEQKRRVDYVIVHPEWQNNPTSRPGNDIALLFFDKPFNLNKNVATISLPRKSMKDIGGDVIVTGWGTTRYQGPVANQLQLVELSVVKDKVCQRLWNGEPGTPRATNSMLCAKSPLGDKGPCHGDSGGPAKLLKKGKKSFLVGVVSFAYKGCLHPEFPAVFTEVAYFLEWIDDEIKVYKEHGNVANKGKSSPEPEGGFVTDIIIK